MHKIVICKLIEGISSSIVEVTKDYCLPVNMWKLVSGKNHKVFFVVNEITIFKETKD
jgi:hypothetical protein